ncbi:hypothetical protein CI102_11744 [Trichoderma harzianum]|nr:hypothetical protein CI102_11744 [Trichoderma harzianum]
MSKSRSRFSVRLAGTYRRRRTSTNHLPGDREKRGVGEWGRCGAMTSYCPMNMRYCSHPAQRGLGHCVSEPVSCEGKRKKKRGKAQPLLLATLGFSSSESSARKARIALCLAIFCFSALLTSSHSISVLVGIVWRRALHHVAAVHAWILCLAPQESLAGLGATSGWPGSATSEYSRRHRAPRPADCRPSMGQVLVPLQYPATGCCGTTLDRTPG